MGAGQAVGFGLGLVIGGVCSDRIGWRWGFFATAILNAVILGVSFWAIPSTMDETIQNSSIAKNLARKVDWIGALIITTSLALLSYELTVATSAGSEVIMRE
ncbi:hypothetical protein MY3957_003347 [Beauveria namnaoensis]